MNRLPTLFFGIFITFASAWLGLILWPVLFIGHLPPHQDPDTQDILPPPSPGLALIGKRVYEKNGCMYCHTQQIRPETTGSDIARGWGSRRTVPRDYIHDKPVLLGTMRTGPDLTNIGRRWGTDAAAIAKHHLHLYAPRLVSPGSIMPPYHFLYETRKIQGSPSPDALKLEGTPYAPPPGYEVVPTAEARALVAYLISLDRTYPLPEIPEQP
ncbi:MAG: cbb3-type cytochrome c oxidase subunit II [Methylacidiphilales bacterium]|nr:cbb3-type cytochrome c oxidase subunit II [Candidatus Methylacidiphilales bacterium]MDW8349691.1 cbb3-type cytochrome c oxidase subunit II [Verrucomicrobiae bacterium]